MELKVENRNALVTGSARGERSVGGATGAGFINGQNIRIDGGAIACV
jgi:hypothetical protein